MKVVAKENLKYDEYPYINWIKGNEYDCWEDRDLLCIDDEQGSVFHFTGVARSRLPEIFVFLDD